MTFNTSRRHFFKNTGAVSAAALLGGTGLTACGGSSTAAALTTDEQFALTASQALAAYKAGTLTATTYVTNLIHRAKSLSDLNAMITIDEAGALAAAKPSLLPHPDRGRQPGGRGQHQWPAAVH